MSKGKRAVLIMILLILIVFLLQINMTRAGDEHDYEAMINTWQQNNLELKSLDLDLASALRTYQQVEEDVSTASSSWSEMVSLFKLIGRDITSEMKFMTVMQREINLEQAKINYEQQQLSVQSSKNQLNLGLRQTYLSYWQAAAQVEALERQAVIIDLQHQQQQTEYEQGHTSKQSFDNSSYSHTQLENKLQAARRSLDQKKQSLNAMVGMPLDTVYEVGIWEDISKLDAKQVDPLIEQALSQRLEIKVIEDRIAINDLNIANYDDHFTYNSMDDSMQESYDELKDQQYYNALELEQQKISIEKEIRIAFLDLQFSQDKLKTVLNQRNDYSHTLDKVREQFNNGSATRVELLQAEYDYFEAQSSYLMAIYEHNTKVEQFSYQIGVGVGFNAGNSGGIINNMGGGRR